MLFAYAHLSTRSLLIQLTFPLSAGQTYHLSCPTLPLNSHFHALQSNLTLCNHASGFARWSVGGLVGWWWRAYGAPYSTPATYGLSCPLAPPLSDFQGQSGSSRPGRNLILLQRRSAPPHLAAAPPEICISTNPSVVGFSRR